MQWGAGDRMRRDMRAWGWIAAVALLPVIAAVVSAITTGWWPRGDEALTALSAWDVLHGHPPVMGPRTTTAFETGIETHHPGPLLYYLLAVPSALAGGSPWGLVVGSALITAALVVTGVAAAHRVGGTVAAACIGAAFLGVMWALGPGAAARPFNPYPPAFATLTWLVLTWALVREHLRYVPHYVVVVSLVLQSHIGYLPFVAGPLLALVALGLGRWWVRRRAVWPRQGWRPRDSGRYRRHVLVALVLALVLWLPPLLELLRFSPNNLTQVLRYIGAERGEQLPIGEALRFVLGVLAPLPGGMTHAGSVDGLAVAHMMRQPRSLVAVGTGAVLLLVLLLLSLARMPRVVARVPQEHRAWLPTPVERDGATVAVGGVLTLGLVITSLPLSSAESTWNYLQTWPVTFFVWALLLSAALRRVALGLTATRVQPAHVVLAATLVPLVVASGAAFASPVPSRWDEGAGVRAALPAVEARLADLAREHDGRLHVTFDADGIGGGYYIAPSIAQALREDYDIHLPAVWTGAEDTDFRKSVTSPQDTAWVSIRAGRHPEGIEGVDRRSQLVAHLTDAGGADYTIFVRGPAREGQQ